MERKTGDNLIAVEGGIPLIKTHGHNTIPIFPLVLRCILTVINNSLEIGDLSETIEEENMIGDNLKYF